MYIGRSAIVYMLGRSVRVECSAAAPTLSPQVKLKAGDVCLEVGASSFGSVQFKNGRRLHVGYGIDDEEWSPDPSAVTFRVLMWEDAIQGWRPLWDATIRSKAGTDGSAHAVIDLPSITGPKKIGFRTECPDRSYGAGGAYWSDISVDP
jgi:hypothetical protein